MSRSNTLSARIEAHLQDKMRAMFAPARAAATGKDADALHAMRVATRRLRISFRYFAALFPASELRQVQRQLRRTTRILGEIRSLDVNLQLLHQAAKHLPADTAAVQRKLTGELLAARQQHVHDLHELLQTFTTSHFEARIHTLTLKPRAVDNQRVLGEAQDLILKFLRQLRRQFKKCRHNDQYGPALHKLRITAKRYRYTLETSLAVFKISAMSQIKGIKKLQNYLGACHDQEVLLEFLQSCRRQWKKADNPLAGRLSNVLAFFQGEHEVAFADVKNFLSEDQDWHKKVKLLLPYD